MITDYDFDYETGTLIGYTTRDGNLVVHRNLAALPRGNFISVVRVAESHDAMREMMNYFGDDSSWPPGWWHALIAPSVTKLRTRTFTRESWTRENYPPSKVSWQEYFGVKSP